MAKFIMALDQGTTSSRSILFDHNGEIVAVSQQEFTQYFPKSGWVEHDAEEIWQSQLKTMEAVMKKAGAEVSDLAGIGITNQRETVVVWERSTGKPICNAIVWQDRRTADVCQQMKSEEAVVSAKTGLRIDPYFSATKVAWILDHVDGARNRAEQGELCFGTIDSWLVWNLTDGEKHVTDASNASRTLLFNIHEGDWDDDLLALFNVPKSMLPEVVDSSGEIGRWQDVAIAGVAGDQQAALFGQACYEPGRAKNTYGTGCFMLTHTGDQVVDSENDLLSTVAWRIRGKLEYALEGGVFIAGALFQWLRDGLGLVNKVQEIDQLASECTHSDGVVLVPAFAGLGAPHWDPNARGVLVGISRGTEKKHICRAAIDAVCFQSLELLECMEKDTGLDISELRVDGGAVVSDVLMQSQADIIQRDIVRPEIIETTAFGAAALAGLGVGFWESRDELAHTWREEKRYSPQIDAGELIEKRKLWDKAVERSKAWA
ncbi:glycerol kinase [Oceaniferula spumae]|uniref:Glycerol kinase n=1 Tax=Oceaniferula spumae TaxID=2979115 RepID=A0AAT9FIC7_9BACT